MSTGAIGGIIINLTIGEGRDLHATDCNCFTGKSSSDPYVKFCRAGKDLGRTKTIKANVNPNWTENLKFFIGADEGNEIVHGGGSLGHLEIQVYDEDLLTEDDCIGVANVPLSLDCEDNEFVWYNVGCGHGKFFCEDASGQIQCKVFVTVIPLVVLKKGESRKLGGTMRIGLGWDTSADLMDLDVSCVALDSAGQVDLKETVYYGNLANSNKSVTHSGDEFEGTFGAGDVEVITCNLDDIPKEIYALYFVLTVATPGYSFNDVEEAHVHVTHSITGLSLCYIDAPVYRGDRSAMFLMRLHRAKLDTNWVLTVIEKTAAARDFGSLIPEIKAFSRDIVPDITIDPCERIAVMRKGSTICASDYSPSNSIPDSATVGLTWDSTEGAKIDLDISAICLTDNFLMDDIIYFNKLTNDDGSIIHSGDERTGDAEDYDETIIVKLNSVPERVEYICFVVTSFSGQELDDVTRASCTLLDTNSKNIIATYSITNSKKLDGCTALVMTCLYRNHAKDDWHVRIIGSPGKAQVALELLPKVQEYLRFQPAAPTSKPPEAEAGSNQMPTASDENKISVSPSYE